MPDRVTPYDFEEFQRRSVRAATGRRSWALSAVASVAMLGLVVTLALVTQTRGVSGTYALADSAPATDGGPTDAVAEAGQPALVDLGQLALRSDLEDRIAWYDAQLSVGRVNSAPPEQLRQLESTRELLANSLQHVSYAHSLLSL
jgi:hypothetical protein